MRHDWNFRSIPIALALIALAGSAARAQCTPDFNEDDDSCWPSGASVGDGDVFDLNFCDDWSDAFRIDACAGRVYTLRATPAWPGASISLGVIEPGCSGSLAFVTATGGAPAVLNFAPPRDDIYLIEIRDEERMPGPGRDYRLEISGDFSVCPCRIDVYEPDDSCVEATALLVGLGQDHDFCLDDVDWATIPACAGREYRILVAPQQPAADVLVEVFEPDCTTPITSGQNAATFTAAVTDWHAVRLSNGGVVGDGTRYFLSLAGDAAPCACAADAREEDDDCAKAPRLGVATALDLDHCDDAIDLHAVVAEAGQLLEIRATPVGPISELELQVRDGSCGSLLASALTGTLDWIAPWKGDFRIRVRSTGGWFGLGTEYRFEILSPVIPTPPGEVSPPGSTRPLVFVDRRTLAWEDAVVSAACVFDVYRGRIRNLGDGSWGECLARGLLDPNHVDRDLPGVGDPFFYLVSGANAAGAGPLGSGRGLGGRCP